MGFYVNPPNGSKEKFLEEKGIIQENLKWGDVPQGFLPVVLVDNGPFTAAGIAYDEREFGAFNLPHDFRPKITYLVLIEDLLGASGEDFRDYIKGI
jgi:hypothetical protein